MQDSESNSDEDGSVYASFWAVVCLINMTETKDKNISDIPIDGFSNVRITSVWTFLQSVSLNQRKIICIYNSLSFVVSRDRDRQVEPTLDNLPEFFFFLNKQK